MHSNALIFRQRHSPHRSLYPGAQNGPKKPKNPAIPNKDSRVSVSHSEKHPPQTMADAKRNGVQVGCDIFGVRGAADDTFGDFGCHPRPQATKALISTRAAVDAFTAPIPSRGRRLG